MSRQQLTLAGLVLVLGSPAAGQPLDSDVLAVLQGPAPPVAPAVVSRDAQRQATVRATRLRVPLQLDGRLDEPVYETVRSITDFIQQLPDEGAPASERTEAWVLFDDDSIYISARCYDSAPPSEWVANEMRRDVIQLRQNDSFSLLDTFYDQRNGLAFLVTPIGGFSDFAISNEGGRVNTDWNTIWDSRTARFDGGWTVEIQIPFKSLRYRRTSAQVWGIQLRRIIRRRTEASYLTPLPISAARGNSVIAGLWRVSQAGSLVGIEVPSGSRKIEIKPYGIGGVTTDINADPPTRNALDGEFGLDVKYGVTQNLTADFTYNTDFAQVEVDEQQVNLTRFSLFFPEKREFFLEARGNFDFARGAGLGGAGTPRLFFSRRIGLQGGDVVPILAGGRLTGKIGAFDVGALSIQTDNEPLSGAQTTNFTVLRVKRDILRRSTIGGIFTNRSVSLIGDGSNQVYGVDGRLAFFRRRDRCSAMSPVPGRPTGPGGMPATSGSSTMPATAMVWTSRTSSSRTTSIPRSVSCAGTTSVARRRPGGSARDPVSSTGSAGSACRLVSITPSRQTTACSRPGSRMSRSRYSSRTPIASRSRRPTATSCSDSRSPSRRG